jgi:hypothetical protein
MSAPRNQALLYLYRETVRPISIEERKLAADRSRRALWMSMLWSVATIGSICCFAVAGSYTFRSVVVADTTPYIFWLFVLLCAACPLLLRDSERTRLAAKLVLSAEDVVVYDLQGSEAEPEALRGLQTPDTHRLQTGATIAAEDAVLLLTGREPFGPLHKGG